jgi:predicted MFS family arabinose efflux permease
MVLAGLVLAKVPHLEWVVVGGLAMFGIAFAVNSSVHSYLILAYAGSEKAAEDVGFYYAANALGRFFGTLMSGLLYQWGGLSAALAGSAVMLVACWLVTLGLPVRLREPGAQAPVEALTAAQAAASLSPLPSGSPADIESGVRSGP